MQPTKYKAVSLIELIIAMAMASILIMASGVLLVGGSRSFRQVYSSIHDPIQQDSKALTSGFGAIARKSNRTNYKLYEIIEGYFIEATPESGESFATGQAVEFRYWDRPFYELVEDMDQMDIEDTGTQYALFYLEGETICVDYGDVVDDVGGIQNGVRQTDNIITRCLAQNVVINENTDIFSHELISGTGNGCVSLNLSLNSELEGTIDVKMASLLRVVWPQ